MKFSVIIPVYNRSELVRHAVESALNQDGADHEVIVVDDGSTDGTAEVLAHYGNEINVISQEQAGAEVARNRGAAAATGEYLVFLDSDDLLLPWALRAYDLIVDAETKPPLVVGWATQFRSNEGAFESDGKWSEAIEFTVLHDYLSKSRSRFTTASLIVIRKDVFDEIGGFRNTTPLTFNGDDFDILLRAGCQSPAVLVNRPATVAYRHHSGNIVHRIPLQLQGLASLVEAERKGLYPGGAQRRFHRYAIIGGPVFFWIRRALRHRYLASPLSLALSAAPMICASIAKKAFLFPRQKERSKILPLL